MGLKMARMGLTFEIKFSVVENLQQILILHYLLSIHHIWKISI